MLFRTRDYSIRTYVCTALLTVTTMNTGANVQLPAGDYGRRRTARRILPERVEMRRKTQASKQVRVGSSTVRLSYFLGPRFVVNGGSVAPFASLKEHQP